ncbi:MAG: hypothetical protein B9S32_14925 [Verrucomicrobia bacterium Tous-C9LFEB]|nr:MAG: hypothetical protein B9S32_14925 [Verrucomicrobia bacterium Tous-C9LFEB]
MHFDGKWERYRLQKEFLKPEVSVPPSSSAEDAPAVAVNGNFAGLFSLQQHIASSSDNNEWTYEVTMKAFKSGGPVSTAELALEAYLTTEQYQGESLIIDGDSFALPVEPGKARILERKNVSEVIIPTEVGRLKVAGEFSLFIQDNRSFNQRQGYLVRFRFSPYKGEIEKAGLSLRFKLIPYAEGEQKIRPVSQHVIKTGGDWGELDHKVAWESGSVLDLSFLNDGPAGNHGRVVATKTGQLEFAQQPGTPVRFYGANVCMMANFQEKEQADKFADQLVRMGYNTVRIHHYDRELGQGTGATSTELKSDSLDRLDYFVHALKQRGIYVSFDLYNLRRPKEGEIAGWKESLQVLNDYIKDYKMLAAVNPAAEENYRTFVRNLLTHRNPYTGLAWKDDPALLSICIWNEANIYAFWEKQKTLYLEAFEKWLKERGDSTSDAVLGAKHPLFERFLYDMQLRMFQRGRSFMDELGIQTLVSDLNMHPHIALNLIRDRMDLVENHIYWDHPRYFTANHQPPLGFSNRSVLFDAASVPASIMPTRLFNKPFALTEYHFSGPNHFRAEAGPVVGAYAALQGWNIIHRFAYAHYPEPTQKPAALRHFDIVTDAVSLLSDRIAVLLFRRGDVRESAIQIPFVMSERWLERSGIFVWRSGIVPDAYSKLGLVVKIGSVNLTGNQALPAEFPAAVGVEDFSTSLFGGRPFLRAEALAVEVKRRGLIGSGVYDPQSGRYCSDTGEVSLDSKRGTFSVVTERTECLVVNKDTPMSGKALSIDKLTGGFAVISVSSLSRDPITSASRLVLFHLTDVQNSGMVYRDSTDKVLEDWGDLPHLARAGTAVVTLQRADPARDEVWRVDLAGHRMARIPAEVRGNSLTFNLSVHNSDGVTFIYEIARTH